MSGAESEGELKPLVEPRVIQFLKDRPRLVNRGVREDFLRELEQNIRARRVPDTMAERTVRKLFKEAEEAGGGVARERARSRLKQANEGPLEKF